MREAEQWPATTHIRFDTGLYLRVEPLAQTLEVYLRFALFEDLGGTVITLPVTKAAHHMRRGRGYRTTAVVAIPSAKKNLGGTPEYATGLEDLRISLGANSAKLRVAFAVRRDRVAGDSPAWKAWADFTVAGDSRGPMHQPDYSDAGRRIAGTIDDLKQFLFDCIARSSPPS